MGADPAIEDGGRQWNRAPISDGPGGSAASGQFGEGGWYAEAIRRRPAVVRRGQCVTMVPVNRGRRTVRTWPMICGILVALVATTSACGSPATSSSLATMGATSSVAPSVVTVTPGQAAPMLPATSVMVPIAANDALVAAIVPTHVTDPCPASVSTEGDIDVSVATRLEPTLGQVLAYGGEHPDEFGNYGLIWHSGSDASVFAAFTTSIDQHRQALEQLVEFPNDLIVCQVAVSADAARALFAKLSSELVGPQTPAVTLGANGVEVTLLPGNDRLADELKQRYGDAVTINICHQDDGCVGHRL